METNEKNPIIKRGGQGGSRLCWAPVSGPNGYSARLTGHLHLFWHRVDRCQQYCYPTIYAGPSHKGRCWPTHRNAGRGALRLSRPTALATQLLHLVVPPTIALTNTPSYSSLPGRLPAQGALLPTKGLGSLFERCLNNNSLKLAKYAISNA